MDHGRLQLGEDDRFAVEMTARATERRNRSTALIALALVVLLVCGIVWLVGWRSRVAALADLRADQGQYVQIEAKMMRLEALRAQARGGAIGGEPITDMGTRLKRIADRAGIGDGEGFPAPDERRTQEAGGVVKTYRYTDVRNRTLEPILLWIARAVDEVPGLEVYQLTISPDERLERYEVNVVFRRWERAQ
jgi:hypothetical protein